MSRPGIGPSAEYVDLHFNHSLWTEDGRNAMKDDDDAISQLALQWNRRAAAARPCPDGRLPPHHQLSPPAAPMSVCSLPAQGPVGRGVSHWRDQVQGQCTGSSFYSVEKMDEP